jgi:glycosyltransferase involved in cell wall biosynthesis
VGSEASASVVIPTYNRAELVLRAVASVQCQSLDDWELLVVDDASTDDTRVLIENLEDPRIRYVARDVNGGVAAAQNTGLDRAVGRHVLFLHSDDELMPECLSRLTDALEHAPPDIGGVEAGLELVERGRTVRRRPYLEAADDRALLSFQSGVHISTLLLKREVAAAVRFDEDLRGVEDRDFCVRLLRTSPLGFEPEPLVRIHRNREGLTAQPKGPIYEYLLGKYHDDIAAAPAMHGDWWFGIARAYERDEDLDRARSAMRQAVRVHRSRMRRWPLWAAACLGDRAFSIALGAYRATARVLSSRAPG